MVGSCNIQTSKFTIITGDATTTTDIACFGTTCNSGHVRMYAAGNAYNSIFLTACNLDNASNAFLIQSSSSNGFAVNTLLKIFNNGKASNNTTMGIGTDNPNIDMALDVTGNVNFGGNGTLYQNGSPAFFSRWPLSNSALMFIPNGILSPSACNVGIGVYPRDNASLDVAGYMNVTSVAGINGSNATYMINGKNAIVWSGFDTGISYNCNVLIGNGKSLASNLDPLQLTSNIASLSVTGDIFTSGRLRATGITDALGNNTWIAGASIQWFPFNSSPAWYLFDFTDPNNPVLAQNQPSIGNGKLVMRYISMGTLVQFYVNLTPGSTTAFGSNSSTNPNAAANLRYAFSLPMPANSINYGSGSVTGYSGGNALTGTTYIQTVTIGGLSTNYLFTTVNVNNGIGLYSLDQPIDGNGYIDGIQPIVVTPFSPNIGFVANSTNFLSLIHSYEGLATGMNLPTVSNYVVTQDTSGNIYSNGKLQLLGSAQLSFTSFNTNISDNTGQISFNVGTNGSLTCRYVHIGTMVKADYTMVCGTNSSLWTGGTAFYMGTSTSSTSTSAWNFLLPANPSSQIPNYCVGATVGSCLITIPGVATYSGIVQLNTSTGPLWNRATLFINGSAQAIGLGCPFDWTNNSLVPSGTTLTFQINYEANVSPYNLPSITSNAWYVDNSGNLMFNNKMQYLSSMNTGYQSYATFATYSSNLTTILNLKGIEGSQLGRYLQLGTAVSVNANIQLGSTNLILSSNPLSSAIDSWNWILPAPPGSNSFDTVCGTGLISCPNWSSSNYGGIVKIGPSLTPTGQGTCRFYLNNSINPIGSNVSPFASNIWPAGTKIQLSMAYESSTTMLNMPSMAPSAMQMDGSGNIMLNNSMLFLQGASCQWSNFTPTWYTTNVAAGGSYGISGRYVQLGYTMNYVLNFTPQTGTAFTSGAWTFTTPLTVGSASNIYVGPVYMQSVDGTVYQGMATVSNNANLNQGMLSLTYGNQPVGASNPFIWQNSSNNFLRTSISYETSSFPLSIASSNTALYLDTDQRLGIGRSAVSWVPSGSGNVDISGNINIGNCNLYVSSSSSSSSSRGTVGINKIGNSNYALDVLGSAIISGQVQTSNLGIGKAPTGYALDVLGSAMISDTVQTSNINVTSNAVVNSLTTTNLIVLGQTSNLGIGKAPTSWALDISGGLNVTGLAQVNSLTTSNLTVLGQTSYTVIGNLSAATLSTCITDSTNTSNSSIAASAAGLSNLNATLSSNLNVTNNATLNLTYRNRIINGDFRLDSKNNGGTMAAINLGSTGATAYAADRWKTSIGVGSPPILTQQIQLSAADQLITGLSTALTISPLSTPQGLVAYFPLDGTLADASGQGYTLTTFGSVTYVPDRFGGQAVYLANEGNVLSTPTTATNYLTCSYMLPATTSHSIALWVYFTKMPLSTQATTLFEFGGATTYATLVCWGGNGLYYFVNSGSVNAATTIGPAQVINTWYHCVVTYVPSVSVSFYLNGTVVSSVTTGVPSSLGAGTIFKIGDANLANTYRPFAGYIDDLRIYNRALSSAEITALANNSYALVMPSNSSLTTYYPFDGTLTDVQGGKTLTATGSLITYVQGVSQQVTGQAIYLPNETNVTVGNQAPTNYLTFTYTYPTTFTVSLWVQFTKLHATNASFVFATGPNTSGYVAIIANATSLNVTSAGVTNTSPSIVPVLWQWYHCVAVCSQATTTGTIACYINGVLTGSLTSTVTTTTTTTFGNATSGTLPFAGYIDDFRIYNTALTPQQVAALYYQSQPNSFAIVSQPIEGANLADLMPGLASAQPMVLSAWVKNNTSSSQQLSLALNTTGLIANLTFENTYTDSCGYMTNPVVFSSNAFISTSGNYKVGSTALNVSANTIGGSTQPQVAGVLYAIPPLYLPVTVSAWIYCTGTLSGGYQIPINFMNTGTTGSSAWAWEICITPSGNVYIDFVSGTTNYGTNSSITSAFGNILTGTWYHICSTIVANGYTRLYINGFQASQGSILIPNSVTPLMSYTGPIVNQLNVGGQSLTSYPFKGYIDDVRLYNRCLTPAQIYALYSVNQAVTTPPINSVGLPIRSLIYNTPVIPANSWQQIAVQIPGDTVGSWNTNAGQTGLNVSLSLGVGSNLSSSNVATWNSQPFNSASNIQLIGSSSTSNAFFSSNINAIMLTGVQLEKGTLMTPFENRPLSIESSLLSLNTTPGFETSSIPASFGKVGIGKAPTGYALDVSGSVAVSGSIKSGNCSFMVFYSGTGSVGVNPLIYNTIHYNIGSCYILGTNLFVAPVNGVYMFTATAILPSGGGTFMYFAQSSIAGVYTGIAMGTGSHTSTSIVTNMNTGDTICPAVLGTGGTLNTHNSFSGALLFATS